MLSQNCQDIHMHACMHAGVLSCRHRCCKSYPVSQWGAFREGDFLDGVLRSLVKASGAKAWGSPKGCTGQPLGGQLLLASSQECLSSGMVRPGFTQEEKKKKKSLKAIPGLTHLLAQGRSQLSGNHNAESGKVLQVTKYWVICQLKQPPPWSENSLFGAEMDGSLNNSQKTTKVMLGRAMDTTWTSIVSRQCITY